MKKLIYISLSVLLLANVSCKSYVETPLPKNELVSNLVFTNDNTATAAVVGTYSQMNAYNYLFANVLINFLTAMSADDLYYYTTFANFDVFKNNALLPGSQYVATMWSDPYYYIYNANACIEGLTASTTVSEPVKKQLLGESYFMRAFLHFYLVNLYGDVPLITSTDYQANGLKPRDPAAVVFAAVLSDLRMAKELMQDNYPSANRVRPNKAAATALLARAYLYDRQWENAEKEASEVIANNRYSLLKDLSKVFLANSGEAIWQLQPVNVAAGRNTWEGFTVTPATATNAPLYRLDSTLIETFEQGDLRKANWTGTYTSATGTKLVYPYKYRVRTSTAGVSEYSMVMRFSEQYLIRAEARAQQNKLSDARADLDTLRHRAGLASLPTRWAQDSVLIAVEKERRVELFTEWGHRWFDLKRTKRADVVLRARKPNSWQATDTLFPIPTDAIKTNPALEQNEGYR